MKPTEQDIQAELIEGWEISEKSPSFTFEEGGYFTIENYSKLGITFFPRYGKTIDFAKSEIRRIAIDFPDFLAGNYDLSAISQHYEPEEWQRIISMCERIVRLITGEQQTLEEKVREIIESGKGYVKPYVKHAGKDRVELVYSSGGSSPNLIVYPDGVFSWATNKKAPLSDSGYIPEFVQCLESIAALLTPSDQPEQTLEEAVRGWVDRLEYMPAYTVNDDHVVIKYDPKGTYKIYSDRVLVEDGPGTGDYTLKEFSDDTFNEDLCEAVRNISAELSKRSTAKPSYEELVERVAELEQELKSCETKYRGRMQELQQVREDYTNCSSVYGQKIEKLQEQLDGAVSEADHEAEMRNNRELLAIITKQRDDCNAQAKQYLSWFHREYAKNAEVK